MSEGVTVEEVREAFDGLHDAIGRLVSQLSQSASVPTEAELVDIVRAPASRLLIARDEHNAVVGTLTLALFRIPTGVRAWIEDVVVDQGARGRGVGEALTAAALRLAKENGARTVDLTSRPSREAANRLYRKMGFAARDTTVYRFDCSSD